MTEMHVPVLEHQLACWLPPTIGIQGSIATELLTIPSEDLLHVENAVPKRRAEFIGGRWCAYQALAKIGMPADGLRVDKLGGPVWPPGAKGSITHDGGVCLAAATRNASILSLGIDLFDIGRCAELDELRGLFLGTDELGALRNCPPEYLALLFSAKESVIKAVSPLIGRLMDFREITLEAGNRTFKAHVNGIAGRIDGRYCDCGHFILTMAVLPNARH